MLCGKSDEKTGLTPRNLLGKARQSGIPGLFGFVFSGRCRKGGPSWAFSYPDPKPGLLLSHFRPVFEFFDWEIQGIDFMRHLMERDKLEIDRLVHRMISRPPVIPLPFIIRSQNGFGMLGIPIQGAFFPNQATERHRTIQEGDPGPDRPGADTRSAPV